MPPRPSCAPTMRRSTSIWECERRDGAAAQGQSIIVTPAKAGVPGKRRVLGALDSRLRGNDEERVNAAMELLHAIPFDELLIQTINGIVTGMILALVASGLTLIFGIMDVVNFAHGELFMLGAYVGVIVLTATGSFWLALVV